jgi:hypothetical protein
MAAKRDGAKSRKMDYQQQIERWNKYQEILDEIGKKCNRRVADVRLARNVYTLSMAGQQQS